MYSVVTHVEGNGITAVHVRKNQADANTVAVELAAEQVGDTYTTAESLNDFRHDVFRALSEHGVYTGRGFDITVIEVNTSDV